MTEVLILSDILKAKAAAQGETRTRADGITYKKIGRKWIVVARPEGAPRKTEGEITSEAWQRSGDFYIAAITETEVGEIVEDALQNMGIADYEALVDKIKNESADTAQEIFQNVASQVRSVPGIPWEQQLALDNLGRSLRVLRDHFSTKPKVALKVKVTSKKGREYYRYRKEADLPTIKPKVIKAAQKKMAGWTVTGPLETKHIKGMLKNRSAKLVAGKIDARKPWVLPKKKEDIDWSYRGDSLLIRVKQVRGMKERTRATAKVEIKVPYAYVKAFLLNQIESKRTANYFIFRIERSEGYLDFLKRAGA